MNIIENEAPDSPNIKPNFSGATTSAKEVAYALKYVEKRESHASLQLILSNPQRTYAHGKKRELLQNASSKLL